MILAWKFGQNHSLRMKNEKIHFPLTCIVQKHLCLSSQLSTKDIKRENLIKQRHPTCIKKVKMSPMWRAGDKENMKTVFWILVIGLELRQHYFLHFQHYTKKGFEAILHDTHLAYWGPSAVRKSLGNIIVIQLKNFPF